MTDLKQPLEDLVEDVPRHVVADDLAATAWAAGRRRRRFRRTAVTGLALAVVALATPVVPTLVDQVPATPADTRSEAVADGYPQRVGRQWWIPDLPDAPGPVAAVMQRAPAGDPDGESFEVAVAEDGRQWRVPSEGYSKGYVGDYTTLSSTGRYLGYFPEDGPPYVIHDLESGKRATFPRVEPHGPDEGPWTLHMQMPAFWSPDDSWLLLRAISARDGVNVLLGPDGRARRVRRAGTWAAGWVDAGHIAWLRRNLRGSRTTGVTLEVSDLDGDVVREVRLDAPDAVADDLSQWSASVSPDGSQVALLEEDMPYRLVHRFSMEDGSRVAEGVDVPDLATPCPLSWVGNTPVVPTYPDEAGRVAALLADEPQTFVASQPGLEVHCFALASSAAAGEPQGLFGTSVDAWTWWWDEALLALAGGAGLWWLLRLRRSRRG